MALPFRNQFVINARLPKATDQRLTDVPLAEVGERESPTGSCQRFVRVFDSKESKSRLLCSRIYDIQVADPFFKFALGEFSVGRCQRMLFPLAAGFLYPIVIPADSMPIETRDIWYFDQE